MLRSNLAAIAVSLKANVHAQLADDLLAEAEEVEREFALRHWKYTQLDGGRVCEIASRILFAADSGHVNLTKTVESCINYLEDDHSTHAYGDRQALLHIAKVIKAAYKLRSQRGAVHVTPKYTADELDSRLILECCRWILAEILRLFASTSKDEIVELIKELSTYPVPLIRSYGANRLLQHTDFTTEEEVLALHYFGPKEGLTMQELVRDIPKDGSGVRRSVKKLTTAKSRELIQSDGKYVITDLGIRRIESVIAQKAK